MANILDVFFIFILVIVVSLLSGIIYLIYLPFKKRLLKSGKLNNRLNRRINLLLVLVPCLIFFVVYYFKDYRTPSKDRLEKMAAIHLPTKYKILKDEYQDMLQDYSVTYIIQFDKTSTMELIKNIKTSKFYNSNSSHNGAWKESDYITGDSPKAVWSKSLKGFDFSRQNGLTSYYIEVDTTTNNLKYNECAN